jgi:hypothetical protein
MALEKIVFFEDLKANGVFPDRMALKRAIDNQGLDPGFMVTPNRRGWYEDVVKQWLATRPIQHPRRHKVGLGQGVDAEDPVSRLATLCRDKLAPEDRRLFDALAAEIGRTRGSEAAGMTGRPTETPNPAPPSVPQIVAAE